MSRNGVQFQKGLSMTEFVGRYGTEAQCRDALVAMRWPDGFVCPNCAGRKFSFCEPKRQASCWQLPPMARRQPQPRLPLQKRPRALWTRTGLL